MSEVIVYHGSVSDAPLSALTFDGVGSGTGVAHQGVGVYFTSSESLAASYCQDYIHGRVYQARLLDNSFLDADAPLGDIDWYQLFINVPFIDHDHLEALIDEMEGGARLGMSNVREKVFDYLIYFDDTIEFDDFDVTMDVIDDLDDMRLLQLDRDTCTNLDLYQAVKANMSAESDLDQGVQASQFFADKLGIGGFRYRDGRTKAHGEDVFNYVVFNPSLIKDLTLHQASQSDLKSGGRGHKPK